MNMQLGLPKQLTQEKFDKLFSEATTDVERAQIQIDKLMEFCNQTGFAITSNYDEYNNALNVDTQTGTFEERLEVQKNKLAAIKSFQADIMVHILESFVSGINSGSNITLEQGMNIREVLRNVSAFTRLNFQDIAEILKYIGERPFFLAQTQDGRSYWVGSGNEMFSRLFRSLGKDETVNVTDRDLVAIKEAGKDRYYKYKDLNIESIQSLITSMWDLKN